MAENGGNVDVPEATPPRPGRSSTSGVPKGIVPPPFLELLLIDSCC